VLGVVGVLEDVRKHCTIGFKRTGDVVLLLGETREDLGGTEYLKRRHGQVTGRPPTLDLDLEKKLQGVCLAVVREGLASSAHDCSDGGLAVTLAECCIWGGLGAKISLPEREGGVRLDAQLFGESPSRIVLSATSENAERIQELAREAGVPISVLGEVGGDELAIEAAGGGAVELKVAEMEEIWRGAIPSLMQQ
jgi:phosphoribosylformylglycinamidine synthase